MNPVSQQTNPGPWKITVIGSQAREWKKDVKGDGFIGGPIEVNGQPSSINVKEYGSRISRWILLAQMVVAGVIFSILRSLALVFHLFHFDFFRIPFAVFAIGPFDGWLAGYIYGRQCNQYLVSDWE